MFLVVFGSTYLAFCCLLPLPQTRFLSGLRTLPSFLVVTLVVMVIDHLVE